MIGIIRGVALSATLISTGQQMDEDEAIELAKNALREAMALEASALAEMDVEQATAMTWPDGSIGCPQKGRVYTQALVPGYLVKLRFNDDVYPMHVGHGRAILCLQASGGRKQGRDEEALVKARMFRAARSDLARRLDVPEKEIEARFLRPETWPDSRLGCPGGDETYLQVETPGYRIELVYRDVTYEVHTDKADRVVLCDEPQK